MVLVWRRSCPRGHGSDVARRARDQEASARSLDAEEAMVASAFLDERLRLARDLHDVAVGHHTDWAAVT